MSIGKFVLDNYKSVFKGNKINRVMWQKFGLSDQKYNDGIYGNFGSGNSSSAMGMLNAIKTIGSFLNSDSQEMQLNGTGFQPADAAAKRMRYQDDYNNKIAMKAIMSWMSMFMGGI
nr:MAG TPA: hypothetical protein [Microviridae sp.]